MSLEESGQHSFHDMPARPPALQGILQDCKLMWLLSQHALQSGSSMPEVEDAMLVPGGGLELEGHSEIPTGVFVFPAAFGAALGEGGLEDSRGSFMALNFQILHSITKGTPGRCSSLRDAKKRRDSHLCGF